MRKKDAEPAEFIVGEAAFTTAKLYVLPVGATPGAKERLLVNESHGIFSRHASLFDWAPDSKTIAFTHNSTKRDDDRFNSDISLVNVVTGKIEPLAKTGASEVSPKYSPDGKWIAYIASDDPPTVMRSHAVRIVPATGGARQAGRHVRPKPL